MRRSTLLVLGLLLTGCTGGSRGSEGTAAAPVDSGSPTNAPADSSATADTLANQEQEPAAATPPVTTSAEAERDTPPAGAPEPAGQPGGQAELTVSQAEYEGWRQYSVNCARCHGQDVLPNPVAANLLISLGPGGPIGSEGEFVTVVSEGRPDRGMPAFKTIMSPEQIRATYAYVKGRAEKRIAPGRPERPS
ncbi:MAG TPA: c-type cytochrome [Gemmatimonadales bacterium]|nr:c-type cytochrome [Gemmatimonadales bacterium]